MGMYGSLYYDDETDSITIDFPNNYGYEGKTDKERITERGSATGFPSNLER